MTIALLAAVAAALSFCEKPAPEPRGFDSRGFGQVVEIFPPRSRRNASDRPVAYMYEVAPPTRRDVHASRRWIAVLIHAAFPQGALTALEVSDCGILWRREATSLRFSSITDVLARPPDARR